jgi:hypothetical protein
VSGATLHSFTGGAVVVDVVEVLEGSDGAGACEPDGGSVVTGAGSFVDVTISDAPLDEHAVATMATATTRAESFDIEREDTGTSPIDLYIRRGAAAPGDDALG